MEPVRTIGHSTRTIEEFLALLREHGVALLVDVRRHPGSRRMPQFGAEALTAALAAHGIHHVHLPGLGGRRRTPVSVASPNTAWRNRSFRAYADHMATEEFRTGLDVLVGLHEGTGPAALMCAEAVPWRCHRWLISDALVSHGIAVEHIVGPGRRRAHHLAAHAVVDDDLRLTYPAPDDASFPEPARGN